MAEVESVLTDSLFLFCPEKHAGIELSAVWAVAVVPKWMIVVVTVGHPGVVVAHNGVNLSAGLAHAAFRAAAMAVPCSMVSPSTIGDCVPVGSRVTNTVPAS